eukprot:1190700-Prorocentrum_minimum.AAC.1
MTSDLDLHPSPLHTFEPPLDPFCTPSGPPGMYLDVPRAGRAAKRDVVVVVRGVHVCAQLHQQLALQVRTHKCLLQKPTTAHLRCSSNH